MTPSGPLRWSCPGPSRSRRRAAAAPEPRPDELDNFEFYDPALLTRRCPGVDERSSTLHWLENELKGVGVAERVPSQPLEPPA